MLNPSEDFISYEFDLHMGYISDRTWKQVLDPELYGSVWGISKLYRKLVDSK